MNKFFIALLCCALAAGTAYAKPGNGQHNGTDNNPGNHTGWKPTEKPILKPETGDTNGGGDNWDPSFDDDFNTPTGQPLPGALLVLALGGAASAMVVLKRRGAKK